MPKKLNANQKIKKQMALWERRVRDAVKRASERGDTWYFRDGWAYGCTRKDYWSSNWSAKKAADRLEKRGTIKFVYMRRKGQYRGGYVYVGYKVHEGRRKVVPE